MRTSSTSSTLAGSWNREPTPSCSPAAASISGFIRCSSPRRPRRRTRARRGPCGLEAMRPGRLLVRSDAAQRLLCWLVQLYVRLIWLTSSWRVEGARNILDLYDRRAPAIVAFWHGRLLMLPLAWHGRSPFHMLISHHRDGRIIAGAVAYFGIGWIKGSSHDGG